MPYLWVGKIHYGNKGSGIGQSMKEEEPVRWSAGGGTDLILMPRDCKMAGENLHPQVVY